MADSVVQEKKRWRLTPEAFGKLLASFDPDRERAGEKYEQIRSGLICFFEWRGGPFPEEHADEAMNRVARKIDEGHQVSDPFTYVYGVARMLLLEVYKAREKERAALAQLPQPQQSSTLDLEQPQELQVQADCLERCLEGLSEENKDFLRRYYEGEKRIKIENRRKIAEQLRIPLNALRLRARRLRAKLEVCVDSCVRTAPQ